MEAWLKISAMLCLFGVIKEFRPSEPYVTKYLNNPPMNFTLDEISNKVYPVGTYSTMVSLVFVFLVTDYFRYKAVIVLDMISGVLVFILLIEVRTVFLVQIAEVFYGFFMAAEVAYYTYIYAKVDKSHYQEVSGHTRSAYLLGRGISGIVSQLFVLIDVSYYHLNFLTLGGLILGLILACLLSPVSSSIYVSRELEDNIKDEQIFDSRSPRIKTSKSQSSFKQSVRFIINDFCAAYSNIYVAKWAFWWALATCGYYQVLSYVTVLWEQIEFDNNATQHSDLNGAIETAYTFTSALASYSCGRLVLDWTSYGESVLFVCSLAIASLLFLMSQTANIIMAYALYVFYAIIYNGMITIANSEIAKHVNPDSHGLIYGFNFFLALVLQSILTFVVNTSLELDERVKFVIYAGYFGVLGSVFGLLVIFKKSRKLIRSSSSNNELDIS